MAVVGIALGVSRRAGVEGIAVGTLGGLDYRSVSHCSPQLPGVQGWMTCDKLKGRIIPVQIESETWRPEEGCNRGSGQKWQTDLCRMRRCLMSTMLCQREKDVRPVCTLHNLCR